MRKKKNHLLGVLWLFLLIKENKTVRSLKRFSLSCTMLLNLSLVGFRSLHTAKLPGINRE